MATPKNEVTSYGFRTTAPGLILPDEAHEWSADLKRLVKESGLKKFGYMVDIRKQGANPAETTTIIQDMMRWLREAGVERSVVVLDSSLARLQIVRLAKSTGTYQWERYMDASSDSQWEKKAVAWIVEGVDPDKK